MQVAGHRALLRLESRIVMPPCATSDVLPDQYVTVDIFDAGMRLWRSHETLVGSLVLHPPQELSSMALNGIFLP